MEERRERGRGKKRKNRKAYRDTQTPNLGDDSPFFLSLSLSHTHTHTHTNSQRKIRSFPVLFSKCYFHLVATLQIAPED